MRRPARHFLACLTLSIVVSAATGCATRDPSPQLALADRPASTRAIEQDYLRRISITVETFQAPPGMIRVFTTTRRQLDAQVRANFPVGFDGTSVFYMGSDADWDYYLFAHHTFSQFYRVSRAENEQDNRMPLVGDSLAWREVKPDGQARSKPSTRP
jgi:hypothetical protein